MAGRQFKRTSRMSASTKRDGHRVQKPTNDFKTSQSYKKNDRMKIMQDTISKTPKIIQSTPGATASSFFHSQQLPPLTSERCPKLERHTVQFIRGDTYAVTRQIMNSTTTDSGEHGRYDDKVAVLNMASDVKLAGATGIPSGPTQEDALCLSSTLYATLKAQSDKYPWKKSMSDHEKNGSHCAAIYSPHVVIFKGSSAEQYEELPADSQRKVVGVISVAAPRNVKASPPSPSSSKDSEKPVSAEHQELHEKIRMIARIAAENEKTVLVLGAMGCGKFNCDPAVVAKTFRTVLTEDEFTGWFEQIVFAIYTQNTLDVFENAWNG